MELLSHIERQLFLFQGCFMRIFHKKESSVDQRSFRIGKYSDPNLLST